jgi:hypothetical protein
LQKSDTLTVARSAMTDAEAPCAVALQARHQEALRPDGDDVECAPTKCVSWRWTSTPSDVVHLESWT